MIRIRNVCKKLAVAALIVKTFSTTQVSAMLPDRTTDSRIAYLPYTSSLPTATPNSVLSGDATQTTLPRNGFNLRMAEEFYWQYTSRHGSNAAIHALEEAVRWCDKEIEACPSSEDGFRMRRDFNYMLGRLEAGCNDELQLIKVAGHYPDSLNGKHNLYSPKIAEEAEAKLQQMIAKDPLNARLYSIRGALYVWYSGSGRSISTKHYGAAALADLTRAIELSPANPDLYLIRAAFYCILEQPEEVMNDCSKVLKLERGSIAAFNMRAFASLSYANENTQSTENRQRLTRRAEKDYSRIIARDATNAAAHYKLAATTSDPEDRADHLSEVCRLRTNDFNPYRELGASLERLHEFKSSIEAYQKCLALNPQFTGTLNDLVRVYRNSRNYAKAMEFADRAIASTTGDILYQAHLERALVHLELGEHGSAIGDCDFVIKNAPLNSWHHANALLDRGIVHFRREAYCDAIADFTASLAEDRNMGQTYYWRAQSYLKIHEKKLAKQDLKAARDKHYRHVQSETQARIPHLWWPFGKS